MSHKDYVSEVIFQVIMVIVAVGISFTMVSAYQNLSPEEKDQFLIYLILMG